MSVELKSEDGTTFPLPPRFWSFFLTLAQTCEWKPKGTVKPKGYGFFKKWHGRYESSDGQKVTAQDALDFSNALNRCFYSAQCMEIMSAVVKQIENEVEKATNLVIPDGMRIVVSEELKESLGELMAFTHKSAFYIL